MLYFDTSFVVPLFLQESTSTRIERVFRNLAGQELAISQWTRVEFSSLLAREVRMGNLDTEAAQEVGGEFEAVAQASFMIFLPTGEDYELAKQYLGRHRTGLRAGDALHLAIAHHNGCERTYSLDSGLLKAGRLLGLPVTRGV